LELLAPLRERPLEPAQLLLLLSEPLLRVAELLLPLAEERDLRRRGLGRRRRPPDLLALDSRLDGPRPRRPEPAPALDRPPEPPAEQDPADEGEDEPTDDRDRQQHDPLRHRPTVSPPPDATRKIPGGRCVLFTCDSRWHSRQSRPPPCSRRPPMRAPPPRPR